MGSSQSSEIQNWDNVKTKLETTIYGQHIAIGEVYTNIRNHYNDPNPSKALVIICNGSLGTGKTYFSQIIFTDLFHGDLNRNPGVKLIVGPRDYPDSSRKMQYQQDLKTMVETTVKTHPRAFFLFDEVDKMAEGLLDVLSPYVDRYHNLSGIDYRKCIFMFLSNTGGTKIDDITLQQMEKRKTRETLMLTHFRRQLDDIVYNETGGLKGSEIIKKRLIDHYVPFLPLEKKHIIECINFKFQSRPDKYPIRVNMTDIANLLEYGPERNPIFAINGAKHVEVHIDYGIACVRRKVPILGEEREYEETSIPQLFFNWKNH